MRLREHIARSVLALTCAFALDTLHALPVAAAADVQVTVDQDQVIVGEPFRLAIEVRGSQKAEPPSLQLPDGLDLRYVGPTTRFSSVNGRVSASVTYSYLVTPRREGEFALGPFRVRVEGETKETEAVRVSVLPKHDAPAAAAGGGSKEPLRMVVTPERTTAYVGERLTLRLELYIGDVAVDNLHFPVVEAEGFALEPFGQPSRREEVSAQRRWTVLTFRSQLTPLRAGALALGPTTMSLEVVEGSRAFGSVFDQFLGRRRAVDVRADALAIDVRPLPLEGRPADFSGAVGQFELEATATPAELRAGDPVTVHIEIRGAGNLESVDPPKVVATDDRLRVYDPTVLGSAAATGKLTIEQVVIPRDETVTGVPPVRFSFFEPESGRYRTLTSGPFPLSVQAAKSATASEVLSAAAPGSSAGPVEKLGRDIVYIKERPGDLLPRARITSYRSAFFLGAQLVPPTLFLLAAGIGRRRRVRNADSPSARFQRAGRIARRELARISAAEGGSAFYDELTAVLARYLGAKLDLSRGSVDRASVLAALDRGAVSSTARSAAARYYDLLEQVRYAPSVGDSVTRSDALELARALVDSLERERGLAAAVLRAAVVLLTVALATLAGASADQPRDPYTIFHDGNSAYRAGDYAGAIREYERLRAAGFESGELLHNLGNAYFKRGAFGRAILSYERARRRLPRDPDIAANLNLARELAKSPAEEPPFWQRVVFAPALALATGELAALWTVLWWGTWAVVAAWSVGRVRKGALWSLGIATGIVGVSFAFAIKTRDLGRGAVVTASGQASALFEPSATGKEHFRVPEGSIVEVREAREGWVQIARADGLRAWLPAEAVERIGP